MTPHPIAGLLHPLSHARYAVQRSESLQISAPPLPPQVPPQPLPQKTPGHCIGSNQRPWWAWPLLMSSIALSPSWKKGAMAQAWFLWLEWTHQCWKTCWINGSIIPLLTIFGLYFTLLYSWNKNLQNISFDYKKHNKLLIVRNLNVGHEIINSLMISVFSHGKPSDVRFGGMAYKKLNGSGKCPDFSFYSDNNPDVENHFFPVNGKGDLTAYPTIVIEVGYSESKQDLAEDCARWIVASLAHVWLAIDINIKYSFTKD